MTNITIFKNISIAAAVMTLNTFAISNMPEFDDKLMLTACGLWNLYLEVA